MGILNAVWCACIKVINAIIDHGIDTLINTLAWLIALLPSLPIQFQPLQWGPFGNLIGYFIPISTMLTHFTIMLGVVILWYSYQHIMRLVRLIK